MGDAAGDNSEAEDSTMEDSTEEKILKSQNKHSNKPLIFAKSGDLGSWGLTGSSITKRLDNYTYGNNKNGFLMQFTRPLSGNPVDISLPYYQQFCNEIRRADGVLLNSRAYFKNPFKHPGPKPDDKLLNGPNNDRKKHLNKHFKNAMGYINEVKASGNMNDSFYRKKINSVGAKTEIARRQVVLKRLKIMETELDKDVTNKILVSDS